MDEREKAYVEGVTDGLEAILDTLIELQDKIDCLLADIALMDPDFMSLQEFLDKGDKGEGDN